MRDKIIELNPMQEGILFECLKHEDQRYIVQLMLNFDGVLDSHFFNLALLNTCKHYDALCSVVNLYDYGQPRIVISENHIPLFEKRDDIWKVEDGLKVGASCVDYCAQPLHALLSHRKNKSRLFITYHHIIMDGWSGVQFISALLNKYNVLLKGCNEENSIKNTLNQSTTYFNMIKSMDKKSMTAFWKEYLSECTTSSLGSPIKIDDQPLNGGYVRHKLSDEIRTQMQLFAEENQLTVSCIFYAAWGLCLSSLINHNDVVFGVTLSGRHLSVSNIEHMIGMFMNCVPMRIHIPYTSNTVETVRLVQTDLLRIMDNQFLPLTQIYQTANKSSDTLYNTVIAIENYPYDVQHELPSRVILTEAEFVESTNVDFLIQILMGKQTEIIITYKPIISSQQAREILDCFVEKIKMASTNMLIKNISDSELKISEQQHNVQLITQDYDSKLINIQEMLVKIWGTVSEESNIDIDMPFFDMGGNSITIMNVYTQLKNKFESKLKLTDFFVYPSIRQLSEHLFHITNIE